MNYTTNKNNLLPSAQKSSGFAFSIAAVLPVLLSFIFLLTISVLGLTANENYKTQDWYLYANYLLPQIAFVAVTVFYFFYTKKSFKQTLRTQVCKPKYFVLALLMQVGLFSLSQLNGWFLEWLEQFGYQDSGMLLPSMDGFGFVGVFLVVVVLASVLEEIIFRGILLNGLKELSIPAAAIFCGGLFALYHQNPAQTLYQFACGMAFAFIALRAGSVLPTILSHFLNNAVVLLLVKYNMTEFTPTVNTIVISVSLACLVGAIVWLVLEREKTQSKPKKSLREFFLYAAVGMALCAFTWFAVLFMGL